MFFYQVPNSRSLQNYTTVTKLRYWHWHSQLYLDFQFQLVLIYLYAFNIILLYVQVRGTITCQDTEQNTEERISWSLPASLNSTSYSHKQLKSIL